MVCDGTGRLCGDLFVEWAGALRPDDNGADVVLACELFKVRGIEDDDGDGPGDGDLGALSAAPGNCGAAVAPPCGDSAGAVDAGGNIVAAADKILNAGVVNVTGAGDASKDPAVCGAEDTSVEMHFVTGSLVHTKVIVVDECVNLENNAGPWAMRIESRRHHYCFPLAMLLENRILRKVVAEY